MARHCYILLGLLICYGTASARQPLGIAFYNVDRLHDTIPALFYNDARYTPTGRLHWNTERYNRKIRNTAAVIDSMRMPLTVLYGVENEQVVRDLTRASTQDYSYIHRIHNAYNGMDFALLYYADLFFPEHIEQGLNYLTITGVLRGQPTTLLVSCYARYMDWLIRDLRESQPETKIIALGRMETVQCKLRGLDDALSMAARKGRGNVRFRSGWHMRDKILIDTAFHAHMGDVFAHRYLLNPQSGAPLATYDKTHYIGGYGNSLPIFVYIP